MVPTLPSRARYTADPAQSIPAALVAITLVVLALGVFFRFYHLDRKVYWGDEVYSSLRMFGDTEAQLVARAGTLSDAHALWTILHPAPPAGSSDPFAPARALALEEPHHTPIYYELAHFWVGFAGNSVAATRSLSAWLSLLALPCAFWLGNELYRSRVAAWTAAALFAVSPVAVLFAQQAREYALWTVALLALEAAFLRGLRLDSLGSWTLFAMLVAFGLYVHPLTALALGGLALYAALVEWHDRAKLLRFAAATALGCAAFVPWSIYLLRDLNVVTGSLRTTFHSPGSRTAILRAFLSTFRLDFIDFDWETPSPVAAVSTGASLLLIVISLAGVIRHRPLRAWLFVVIMLLATTLPLLIPDLLEHGQRIREQRYLIPALVMVDLCVAGWLSSMLASPVKARSALGYALLVGLLAAATGSCAASSASQTWWSTQSDNSISVARAIDRSKRPLLISDGYLLYPLVLSNYLDANVQAVLWPKCYECRNPVQAVPDAGALSKRSFATMYAIGPSPALERLLAAFAAQHPAVVYRCVNVHDSCLSDLNIELRGQGAPPPDLLRR